ncbi:MAG TPA: branched-chain amino acid transaminase [Pyrinomonadaceae bacterium]
MGFEQSKWVWMNGEMIPWHKATVHVSAHGLHYGSGVFEGIRCYETEDGPAVFRLNDHLARLLASAAVYGMEIPFSQDELARAVREVIERSEFSSCYVRPVCFYGSESLALHPRNCPVEVAIFAWPWAPYLGTEGLEQGIRLTVSPWRKFHSDMLPTTAKACGQYLNSILAIRDAAARGFDEALLLDRDGYIAEGSGENLFIVREGKVFTNDQQDSILLGVTRDSVIQIARDLGYTVEIAALRLKHLQAADEAFLTGTAAEVTPVRELDGMEIGNGGPGAITGKIQKNFFAAVAGRDERYRHWLDFVRELEEMAV